MKKTAIKKRKLLSSEGVIRVVRAIQAAPAMDSLTWSDIQRIAGQHAGDGYIWTRQALERHPEIKSAYLAHDVERRKRAKRGGVAGRRLSEPQKIARLESEIEVLRKTLRDYDERFATYLVNATRHGLTVEQLADPLQRPSRGRGNSDA